MFLSSADIELDPAEYSLARSAKSSGGYGTVFRCMHMKTGFQFATKIINAQDSAQLQVPFETHPSTLLLILFATTHANCAAT